MRPTRPWKDSDSRVLPRVKSRRRCRANRYPPEVPEPSARGCVSERRCLARTRPPLAEGTFTVGGCAARAPQAEVRLRAFGGRRLRSHGTPSALLTTFLTTPVDGDFWAETNWGRQAAGYFYINWNIYTLPPKEIDKIPDISRVLGPLSPRSL